MEFEKNTLIGQTMTQFFELWSLTLNTSKFVDAKYLKKIDKYIYKNFKKKLKEVEIYNLLVLKDKGLRLGLFKKLKIKLSGLKPLYLEAKNHANASPKNKDINDTQAGTAS